MCKTIFNLPILSHITKNYIFIFFILKAIKKNYHLNEKNFLRSNKSQIQPLTDDFTTNAMLYDDCTRNYNSFQFAEIKGSTI